MNRTGRISAGEALLLKCLAQSGYEFTPAETRRLIGHLYVGSQSFSPGLCQQCGGIARMVFTFPNAPASCPDCLVWRPMHRDERKAWA
jgi:hypothetical protein